MSTYAWIIIIVIAITIGVGLYLVFHYDMEPMEICAVFLLGGIFHMSISESMDSKYPKPIDVYRGKTTLKISYVDTIPQDTLVIWKTEFKN
jgi:multisubunit Na+/H+ antiporter MnhC subunit